MELLNRKPGEKVFLLGNEAIVRGALESGVQFVSTYPGTPASEIGNIFFEIAPKEGIYFEFSTNEKVALEAAVGSSFSGLKTLVAMKNFGLNVCLDALLPFAYTGTKGPTVIIVADDPSCHSSAQSEENSRPIAYLSHIPVLEPSDPQECKDFVKLGFDLSEKFNIPVIVRTTTRVAHQKMPVVLGRIVASLNKGHFTKNYRNFVTLPPRVLEMKKELLDKIKLIQKFSEKSPINRKEFQVKSKVGIITSAVSYLYVREALEDLELKVPILKIGFFYPLPEKKIKAFLKKLKTVLIVEELEPYLEKEVTRLAKEANCKIKIMGKNLLPEVGELKPEAVLLAVAKLVGRRIKIEKPKLDIKNLKFPKRFPQLCPGCPYWLVFGAVKKATQNENVIYGGDIGCYMLAGMPPHLIQDYLFCMGASIGIGHGIKKATNQKLIAFIGDSTFFHSGITPLINTVFNRSNPLIIILRNQTTAMTGHQPHPGASSTANSIKIEEIVKALGIKNLKVLDPINQDEFISTIKDFLNRDEVSVIIADRPCKFVTKK